MERIVESGVVHKKCHCGKRWMKSYAGDVMFAEDFKITSNLISYVNQCDCMKKQIQKS